MARLRALPSRLKALPPRLQSLADDGASRTVRRRQETPWRAWYSTARWQRLSLSVRAAALFTCAMCGAIRPGKGETVTDHKIPHRGDPDLFWDERNLQCLCKACHDGAKQAEERRGLS